MRRVKSGGEIDRASPIRIRFDGRTYAAFTGDTLASALIANGVCLVGRSFKYHRPRGIIAAGVEEPNGLVSVGIGADRIPNLPATTVELRDGLIAESQNRWPTLALDLLSVNQLAAPLLGPGFYYKTFMSPGVGAWTLYERFIRRAAGLGKPPVGHAFTEGETIHDHCDVLVVGGGPAGLEAAVREAKAGRRVVLVERDFVLGGQTLATPSDSPERIALADHRADLMDLPTVTVLKRTTAFGAYDHDVYGLAEDGPTTRLRIVHAPRLVLAAGAIERGVAFPGNDKPGVMLAGAVRTYLNRFAVLCGNRAVVFTANDTAFETALDLTAAGANVTLVDARPEIHPSDETRLAAAGIDIRTNARVMRAYGRTRVTKVRVSEPGGDRVIRCDLVCVSGGWSPALHLTSHRGVKSVWYDDHIAFLPGDGNLATEVVGAAAGVVPRPLTPSAPLWRSGGARMAFVDLQNDVTVKDVMQAHDEGFESVEHLKRYTTLGMGTDQGKTANVTGLALMAERTGKNIPATGTTTFRPPYAPVSLGALAGQETGARFHMIRRSPLHAALREDGAEMTISSLWERAWFFRCNGATVDDAYVREMQIVRSDAAISDASSLGKFDVQGPDAAEFLNRVYTNGWKSLPVGKARWGVMLRDDGYVFDDGTTSRIDEHRYFMTTTTANAGRVLARLEFLLQTEWADLRVHVVSVTDQWAAIVLAGPKAREVLAQAARPLSVSDAALPFMGVLDGEINGVPVRILRVSFSGELSFEVYAPAHDGARVWRGLRDAGAGVYGLEALGALRIEKGHVAGNEMDGRTTLEDLGLGRMASTKKTYVGSVLARRDGLMRFDRRQLVGLEALEGKPLSTGAVLSFDSVVGIGDGRVTSATWSPSLGRHIALALVKGGRTRCGETITVHDPARGVATTARIRDPHFLDPDGERMRG